MKVRNFSRNNDGAAAIEFAIVAPLFILILLTLVGYGIYLSVAHSVQQLAADAARASIAGLSEAERQDLANTYIHTSKISNGFLDQDKLAVRVANVITIFNIFRTVLQDFLLCARVRASCLILYRHWVHLHLKR